MSGTLTELDSLLADLNRARYCESSNNSDVDSGKEDNHPYVSEKKSTKTKHLHQRNKTNIENKSCDSFNNNQDKKKNSVGPFYRGSSSTSPSPTRAKAMKSSRHAPTLTSNSSYSRHGSGFGHQSKNQPRMAALTAGKVTSDEEDIDYDYTSKWEYLGKGIWENQDYGSISNYSTLRSGAEELDYETLSRSGRVSQEELEKETGAGPRGDRSRFIETDSGLVQSKYRYMGFGLWENLDPTAPKKIKKMKPPPPPPKAEPIWYNCTVTVSNTVNSKELDDLLTEDFFTYMETRDEWCSKKVRNLQPETEDPVGLFDKEDMTDMFGRAMFEKMQLVDDPRVKYKCYVCSKLIEGRIITAMGNKFHPQCFVCTYCRGPFRERKYKTDPREGKPYCLDCFDKLLGHFGNIHSYSAHG